MSPYSINKFLSRQVTSLNNLINGNVALSNPPIYEKNIYLHPTFVCRKNFDGIWLVSTSRTACIWRSTHFHHKKYHVLNWLFVYFPPCYSSEKLIEVIIPTRLFALDFCRFIEEIKCPTRSKHILIFSSVANISEQDSWYKIIWYLKYMWVRNLINWKPLQFKMKSREKLQAWVNKISF